MSMELSTFKVKLVNRLKITTKVFVKQRQWRNSRHSKGTKANIERWFLAFYTKNLEMNVFTK